MYFPRVSLACLCLSVSCLLFVGCPETEPDPVDQATSETTQDGATSSEDHSSPTDDSSETPSSAVTDALDLKYISADFTSAVVIHPNRFLNSEFVKANEATGAPVLKGMENGIKQSGIDPRSVAQVILLVDEETMMEASQFVPMMFRPLPGNTDGAGEPVPSFPEPSTTTGSGDRPEEAPEPDLPKEEFDGEPANPEGQGAGRAAGDTLQPVNFQPPGAGGPFEAEASDEGHGDGGEHGRPGMMGEPPTPTLIVRFVEPVDPETFFDDKPFPPMEDAEFDGLKIKKTPAPMKGPILHFPDNQTLILTKPELLKTMIDAKSVNSPLVNELKQIDASNDMIVVTDVTPLRPMLGALAPLLAAEGSPQGPIVREFLPQWKTLTLTAGVSNDTLLSVNLVGESAETMTKLNDLLTQMAERGREQYQMQKKMALQQDNPFTEEFKEENIKMMEAMSDEMVAGMTNVATGTRLTVTIPKPRDFDKLPSVMQPIIEKTLGSAKNAEIRMKKENHLKTIGIAFLNYHDVHGGFPRAGSDFKGEKSGLSWRVHLLPYLDQTALYEKFHLDESWDSDHNKELISHMPEWFQTPEVTAEGKTAFQVFVGKGTAFEEGRGLGIPDITDGTSNTLLVIETSPDSAGIWTKPGGLLFEEETLLDAFQTPYSYGFLFLAADVSVHQIRELDTKLDTFKNLITRNGGEVIDYEELD